MIRSGILVGLMIAGSASCQVAAEANRQYQTEQGRTALAKSLGNPARDQQQKPGAVVAALGIKSGSTVADIGTGVGYMLPWLSKAVGGSGTVLAEDIQSDFLATARKKTVDEKLGNVKLILGEARDPKLPSGAVDLILLLDVYHHFDYPEKMLGALAAALRGNGRIAVVEYYKNQMAAGHIRLDHDDVIREVESYGFRLTSRNDHITSRQYLLIFVR